MRENLKEFLNRIPSADWQVVSLVLIAKTLIMVFAVQSYQIVLDKPLSSSYRWLSIWAQWDANRYLNIATEGYKAVGEGSENIAFFPLYPMLTAIAGIFVRDTLIGAFIVSAIASLATGLLLRRLVALDYTEEVSRLSVWFLFIFPTSYFLHIPYTESLFLSLSIGCFYMVRKGNWLAAALLGELACMSRINGLILLPAIAVELFFIYRQTKKFDTRWLCLLLIPLGFLSYLFINYYVYGNPFAFTIFQKNYWYKELAFPWAGLKGKWDTFAFSEPSESLMVGYQEVFFVALGVAATVWSWFRLRTSYAVWMTLNWLLFVSTSFILSVPRYTLAMFPLFIIFGEVSSKSFRVYTLITVWSIVFLGLFIIRFITGIWGF